MAEVNLSDIAATLTPSLSGDVSSLITLAKAAGIIFIIYLIFLIGQVVLRIRFAYNVRKIEKNVADINRKLDHFLKKK